jgi:hypothetical protein
MRFIKLNEGCGRSSQDGFSRCTALAKARFSAASELSDGLTTGVIVPFGGLIVPFLELSVFGGRWERIVPFLRSFFGDVTVFSTFIEVFFNRVGPHGFPTRCLNSVHDITQVLDEMRVRLVRIPAGDILYLLPNPLVQFRHRLDEGQNTG